MGDTTIKVVLGIGALVWALHVLGGLILMFGPKQPEYKSGHSQFMWGCFMVGFGAPAWGVVMVLSLAVLYAAGSVLFGQIWPR